MTISVKTPYDAIPYDILADPEQGPLPLNATRREVDARYAHLSRRGRNTAVQAAWDALHTPAKRAAWDVFCSAADRGQAALRKLVDEAPPLAQAGATSSFDDVIGELIGWQTVPAPQLPPLAAEGAWDRPLSGAYDHCEQVLHKLELEA
jgi:hypothetical protein